MMFLVSGQFKSHLKMLIVHFIFSRYLEEFEKRIPRDEMLKLQVSLSFPLPPFPPLQKFELQFLRAWGSLETFLVFLLTWFFVFAGNNYEENSKI